MGQVVCLGLCLLGCLLLNPSVEGFKNHTEAQARCPHGAFYYRQFCYQYFDKSLSWDDAEIACQALETGSEVHLASILSPLEGRIIARYLNSKRASNVWVGLQGIGGDEDNVWYWSDGSPFSLPLWDGSFPSTSSNECVSLNDLQNPDTKNLNQHSCFDTLPYLCKFKASSPHLEHVQHHG